MIQRLRNYINRFSISSERRFVIVASAGGCGSSFLIGELLRQGFAVCIRPDGGANKIGVDPFEVYKSRTRLFYRTKLCAASSEKERAEECLRELSKLSRKVALVSMRWGYLGLFRELDREMELRFLVRNPLFAFMSYSGLGWRSEGGLKRVAGVGAQDYTDRAWIDAWLGDFGNWLEGAGEAMRYIKEKPGNESKVALYHKFQNHFDDLITVDGFRFSDSEEKLSVLDAQTRLYIERRTSELWSELLRVRG